MNPAEIALRCTDGVELSGQLFTASGVPLGTVVIAPALGISRSFYGSMAEYLAGKRFNAITFDYRGIGGSAGPPLTGARVRLDDWGRLDMDAVLGFAMTLPGSGLYLLGHSAGGQLFGLAPNSVHLDGLVMVSSLIPWWRSFPWPRNLQVWALMHLLMPLFSVGRDYFPARRLRISSVDVPSGVTKQWCRWGRGPDYFFDERWGLDLHRYDRFEFPLLVCHIDDDDYAPWAAIQRLLEKLPAARKEIWHVDSGLSPTGSVGHVNFFREHMRDVYWDRIAAWLEEQSANATRRGYDKSEFHKPIKNGESHQ